MYTYEKYCVVFLKYTNLICQFYLKNQEQQKKIRVNNLKQIIGLKTCYVKIGHPDIHDISN